MVGVMSAKVPDLPRRADFRIATGSLMCSPSQWPLGRAHIVCLTSAWRVPSLWGVSHNLATLTVVWLLSTMAISRRGDGSSFGGFLFQSKMHRARFVPND